MGYSPDSCVDLAAGTIHNDGLFVVFQGMEKVVESETPRTMSEVIHELATTTGGDAVVLVIILLIGLSSLICIVILLPSVIRAIRKYTK